MEFEEEKAAAMAMLEGIVLGSLEPDELFQLLDAADPTLVHLLLRYAKKHYHRDHEHYDEVRGRLKDLTNSYRSLTRKAKEGETDPVVDWFEGTHRYSELEAAEFIDIIVDKLEG